MIYRLCVFDVLMLWYFMIFSVLVVGFWLSVSMVIGDGSWLYCDVFVWLCVVYLNCMIVNIVLFFMLGMFVFFSVSSELLFG